MDVLLDLVVPEAATGPVAIVTLNRPHRANAYSANLIEEFHAILDLITERSDVRAIVVTGVDPYFSAGGDLGEKRESEVHHLGRVRSLFSRLTDLTPLSIAAINGPAVGGGCELALACDLRYMDPDARIGLPEVKFGAVAYAGGTQRLPRLVGPAKALELHVLANLIGAQEALDIGLVNGLSEPGGVLEQAMHTAATIASRPADAVALARRLIRKAGDLDLSVGLKLESESSEILHSRLEENLDHAAQIDPVYARIKERDGDGEVD